MQQRLLPSILAKRCMTAAAQKLIWSSTAQMSILCSLDALPMNVSLAVESPVSLCCVARRLMPLL